MPALILSLLLLTCLDVFPETTWLKLDGKIYGAKPDERGPIGGGEGYYDIITEGDYKVRTLEELIKAMEEAREGEIVFVPDETEIDFTTFMYIEDFTLRIPGGVTLAGNRGHEKSKGALLFNDHLGKAGATNLMIEADGPDVRITGLRIRGPNTRQRLDHHRRSFGGNGRGRDYYYKFPIQGGVRTEHKGLRVDNCEIWGFGHAAIYMLEGEHHVHHNFIHHNQYHGLGYGVCLDKAWALIEYNQFNYNRHSIAGTGRAPSGYKARHNTELGAASSHCFDMHGRHGQAGTTIEIYNNTFYPPQRAVVIRNAPEKKCEIYRNWFVAHDSRESAVGGSRGAAGLAGLDVFDNIYTPEAKRIE